MYIYIVEYILCFQGGVRNVCTFVDPICIMYVNVLSYVHICKYIDCIYIHIMYIMCAYRLSFDAITSCVLTMPM